MDGDPDDLVVARRRWRAAEERLYPLALADTDAYMDAIEAVGRVVAELRRTSFTHVDLLEQEADHALLEHVGTASRSPVPLEPAIVIAAACALRSAELSVDPTEGSGGST